VLIPQAEGGDQAMSKKIVKLTLHESGKAVVNMPGSGMRPRVFRDKQKALALVSKLAQ
jgi:hypothetical protein